MPSAPGPACAAAPARSRVRTYAEVTVPMKAVTTTHKDRKEATTVGGGVPQKGTNEAELPSWKQRRDILSAAIQVLTDQTNTLVATESADPVVTLLEMIRTMSANSESSPVELIGAGR